MQLGGGGGGDGVSLLLHEATTPFDDKDEGMEKAHQETTLDGTQAMGFTFCCHALLKLFCHCPTCPIQYTKYIAVPTLPNPG